MISIITGVRGMSLMSTHHLGTKGQDGQSHIIVRSPLGTMGWDGHLLTSGGTIIGVQGISLMSMCPLILHKYIKTE